MEIKVNSHDICIKFNEKINVNEYNITKCKFEFSKDYTEDLVKVALFTNSAGTYKKYINNNECDIPAETLEKNEITILGVYAYKEENDNLLLRFSPEPIKFFINKGSYIADANNSEPITPTDKEQIEQSIVNLENSKQDKLISGVNIKTINNESILGGGNIKIPSGGSSNHAELSNLDYAHSGHIGFQEKIDSSHKLNSDFVDDTNSFNKFVTDDEKNTWNNKSNFSGNYNDLTDKPTIPTVNVNDVKVNGTSVVTNGVANISIKKDFELIHNTTLTEELGLNSFY